VGPEAICRVRHGDRSRDGKALLASAELTLRGDYRFKIAFRDVDSAEAAGDERSVRFSGELAAFEPGPRNAAAWAGKINSPRKLLDKLGIRAGPR